MTVLQSRIRQECKLATERKEAAGRRMDGQRRREQGKAQAMQPHLATLAKRAKRGPGNPVAIKPELESVADFIARGGVVEVLA